MKVNYLAALAAASVLGLSGLASCAPQTEVDVVEPDATESVDPCAADPCAAAKEDPCAADPCAAAKDPCAADPCAADPCAADPCAAE